MENLEKLLQKIQTISCYLLDQERGRMLTVSILSIVKHRKAFHKPLGDVIDQLTMDDGITPDEWNGRSEMCALFHIAMVLLDVIEKLKILYPETISYLPFDLGVRISLNENGRAELHEFYMGDAMKFMSILLWIATFKDNANVSLAIRDWFLTPQGLSFFNKNRDDVLAKVARMNNQDIVEFRADICSKRQQLTANISFASLLETLDNATKDLGWMPWVPPSNN